MSVVVFELAHWRCRSFDECPLPGYLIVEMIRPVGSFAALSPDAAAEFGSAVALAGRIIEAVIQPERVYASRWGEVLPDLHVHLFPRTRWVLDHYRRAFPGEGPPSGPALFEWARTRYGTSELPPEPGRDGEALIARMRSWTEPGSPGSEPSGGISPETR